MPKPLRVLLVEDSALDAELICDELRRAGFSPSCERVDRAVDVAGALDGAVWDIVVCDHGLVDFGVADVIGLIRKRGLDLPVIVVTGAVGEESAADLMRTGARDLVVKSHLGRLAPAIERELAEAASRRELERAGLELRRTEGALFESEERFRRLAENARDIIYRYRLRPTPGFEYVSPSVTAIVGYTPEEHYADPTLGLKLVHPEDRHLLERLFEQPAAETLTLRWLHKDGGVIWTEQQNVPVYDEAGELVAVEGVARDVSERMQLEEQLRQSQKMEAIGRLAGGIAHDFNNLLTAIAGYSELIPTDLDRPDDVLRDAAEIREAAERAAALTRQLLAFSRRQVLELRVLDLNGVVSGLEGMLARLIGEDVDLVCVLPPSLGSVRADPGQLEQVVVNLAVNARDAMPRGGKLTIETANVDLDEDYVARHSEARPGPHVLLAVTDTGHGMDAETQQHVFEPFFTTKAEGEGTGLGLSTVYGIVTQCEGHVAVYSELGTGTAFKVYLPSVSQEPQALTRPAARGTSPGDGETILLVEDDAAVRDLASRVLEERGYTVLAAPDGPGALAFADTADQRIDLLVTDTVLPTTSGPELAATIQSRRPSTRVLYTSGYADAAVARHGLVGSGAAFLSKPFSPPDLANKVREVLDEGS